MKLIIQKLGLLVVMLLTVMSASAYDFEVDGIFYSKASDPYTGNGTVYVAPNPNATYTGDISIPRKIQKGGYQYTVIGVSNNAFKNCTALKSVTFSFDEDIDLGSHLFEGCTILQKIKLPNHLTGIPSNAFESCTSLREIEIPSTVRIIESQAFASCASLSQILLPSSLQILGEKAFDKCESLMNVFFSNLAAPYCEGDSENNVFSNCNASLNLWVPSNLVYPFGKEYISIERSNFEYTANFPDVNIENNVKDYLYSVTNLILEKNVGEYDTIIGVEYNGAISFTISIPFSYTITAAPLVAIANDSTREYGNQNPIFVPTYIGFKEGDNEDNSFIQSPQIICAADVSSNVGQYELKIVGGVSHNYMITEYKNGILTIKPAPLTLSANNMSRLYYEENPDFEFSLSGLRNSDDESCLSKAPTYACAATLNSDCGQYDIMPSSAESKNYKIEYKKGTLTVNPNGLILVATDVSREYGDVNPLLKYEAVGLKGDDDLASCLDEEPTLTTNAVETSAVGEYRIQITGGSSKNYKLSYRSGVLTVTKAPLTVIAKNAERMYGDDNPAFTRSYLGFKLNDTESSAFSSLPKLSCAANKASDVGTYPIAVTGGTSRNYDFVAYENGTLTVTKAPLVLSANDKNRLYYEDNPIYDFSLTGLRNGDAKSCLSVMPEYKCQANKLSDVGNYAIVPSGADAKNYSIEYRNGTLRISPRQLTVSVGDYSKIYGTDNPQFEVTYSGFVNNEDKSVLTSQVIATCSAERNSDVGTYPIVLDEGNAINYVISKYNNGTLFIEKANQTLTWNQDLSNIPQYSQVALEATSSAELPVTYEMSPNNVATLYDNGGTWYLDCYGSGAVNIRAIQNGDKNHNAASMLSKTLVVFGSGGDPSNPQIYFIAVR